VGKLTELSVSPNKQIVNEKDILHAARDFGSVRLSFILNLTEQTQISWETVLWNSVLYVQVPSCILPGGSKEGFVGLLEYAEEVLHCSHVVVCMKKDRADRALLVRTFMFLGFSPMPPGHVLIPANTDPANLFMLYSIE